jgi:hypothetical protein
MLFGIRFLSFFFFDFFFFFLTFVFMNMLFLIIKDHDTYFC